MVLYLVLAESGFAVDLKDPLQKRLCAQEFLGCTGECQVTRLHQYLLETVHHDTHHDKIMVRIVDTTFRHTLFTLSIVKEIDGEIFVSFNSSLKEHHQSEYLFSESMTGKEFSRAIQVILQQAEEYLAHTSFVLEHDFEGR